MFDTLLLKMYENPNDMKLAYEIRAKRQAGYAKHMLQMAISIDIKNWEAAMKEKYGEKAKIWAHDVSWPTALMIARYGEAIITKDEEGEDVQFWPNEFSEADVARGVKWLIGKSIPDGVAWRNTMELRA